MSEPKFTPGPWTVDGREVVGMVGEIDTCIAECFDHSSIDRHNAKFNAHLIASAPELYAVLEYVRDVLGPHDRWADDSKRVIEAALAKARGEA